MGTFSWLKADNLTKVENIVKDISFKFLIPIDYGGGYIKDYYQGYGDLGIKKDRSPKYDMYELLAFWNHEQVKSLGGVLKYNGCFPKMKEVDEYTNHNRNLGIDIGCYNEQIVKLKYPLKLVSASYKGCYEDLEKPSLRDPNQGLKKTYRS